ncbi:hypothetical protein N8Z54_04210 [Octadecabacter sp.]|nr:hypothetical protein [Octadecabacter sp.]
MTLKPSYFHLMDHLGATQPVCAMPPDAPAQDLICLRHDIDHSLDVALEMAFWEHDRGLRATYYLLNSTDYWSDPDFDIKVRQLLAFGHEVGVHVNSVANWLGGRCATPAEDLHAALNRLRALGADANSTAAHGDKLCYQHGATNFWMFSEEMRAAKAGEPISAEGIAVSDPAFQIKFPEQPRLTRTDGQTFELGSLKLQDFGLSFLGHRAGWDRYFSDSGGGWTRTSDPLDVTDIGTGRSMVLVHPIHWRAPPRQIYILSPARSGSTWLAHVAERASSAMGVHEQTFNYRNVEGVFTAQKRTHSRIDALYENRSEQLELLRDRRSWFDAQECDVLECNVYLAPALEALKQVNPDARFAALLRDPRDILVSLLNRGWYSHAYDDKHPAIDVPDRAGLDQVEKAAHYIADTRARILEEPGIQLADLARLNQSPEALHDLFISLGLAFYPLLAEPLREQRINANTLHDLSGFEAMPERDQLRALEIIYAGGVGRNIYPYKSSAMPLPNPRAFGKEERVKLVSQFRLSYVPGFKPGLELKRSSSQIKTSCVGPDFCKSLQITVPEGHNGAIMIGSCPADTTSWFTLPQRCKRALASFRGMRQITNGLGLPKQALKIQNDVFDLPHSPEQHYHLKMSNLGTEGLWQLMVQTFDRQGAPVLLKRLIPQLVGPEINVPFDLPASAHSMRIVLYSPKADQVRQMSLSAIKLDVSETTYEEVPLDELLVSRRILVLAKTGWSADHGGPEAAKSLARAGLGTVIWANFDGATEQNDPSFVCSEGVNFITLSASQAATSWVGSIAQIKAMCPDRVIDLDGATSRSFQSACAQANIDLIHSSQDRVVDHLVSDLKK